MTHFGLVREVEQLGVHLVAGQRRHRERGHELPPPRGHDTPAGDAPAGQLTDQLQRFVGSNATTYDQENTV